MVRVIPPSQPHETGKKTEKPTLPDKFPVNNFRTEASTKPIVTLRQCAQSVCLDGELTGSDAAIAAKTATDY